MKDYLKPEAEVVKFDAEDITVGTGEGVPTSNDFTEDDFVAGT